MDNATVIKNMIDKDGFREILQIIARICEDKSIEERANYAYKNFTILEMAETQLYHLASKLGDLNLTYESDKCDKCGATTKNIIDHESSIPNRLIVLQPYVCPNCNPNMNLLLEKWKNRIE